MQYLLYVLAFIAGSMFTIAVDVAAGKMRQRRLRKAYELKARIIREHELKLNSWGSIDARGHGPWCTSTCAHLSTRA